MLFFFQILDPNDGFSKHHGFPIIYQYKVISLMGIQGAHLPNATHIITNPLGSPINNRGPIGCTKTQKGHCDFEATWMFGWKLG